MSWKRAVNGAPEFSCVEYFSGATRLGETTIAPHRFAWRAAAAGFHRVMARATLASGAVVETAALHLDVLARN